MKTIAIANQKGGVSKTTSAINISYYLAFKGYKTLLVDLDPQASASSGLGLRKNEISIYDLFYNRSFKEVVRDSMSHINLKILPSHQNLAAFESEGILIERKESKLKDVLSELINFDFVIIDCPPSLGLLTINALVAADQILIPVQTEFFALEGLSLLLETIAKVKNLWNKDLDILGILLTMCDCRNILHKEVINDVKLHFNGKVFRTYLRRNIRLAESVSFGQTIGEYDKNSVAALLYREVVKEILERLLKS